MLEHSLDSLPRRIFLDSCTATQTLGNYGGYIFEGEQISDADRRSTFHFKKTRVSGAINATNFRGQPNKSASTYS